MAVTSRFSADNTIYDGNWALIILIRRRHAAADTPRRHAAEMRRHDNDSGAILGASPRRRGKMRCHALALKSSDLMKFPALFAALARLWRLPLVADDACFKMQLRRRRLFTITFFPLVRTASNGARSRIIW